MTDQDMVMELMENLFVGNVRYAKYIKSVDKEGDFNFGIEDIRKSDFIKDSYEITIGVKVELEFDDFEYDHYSEEWEFLCGATARRAKQTLYRYMVNSDKLYYQGERFEHPDQRYKGIYFQDFIYRNSLFPNLHLLILYWPEYSGQSDYLETNDEEYDDLIDREPPTMTDVTEDDCTIEPKFLYIPIIVIVKEIF